MLGSEKRHRIFGLDSNKTYIETFCNDWRETIEERDTVYLFGDTGPKLHRYLYKDLPGRKIIVGKTSHETMDPIWHDHQKGVALDWVYKGQTTAFYMGSEKGDVRLHTEVTEAA